jgi:uncharacterized integral membrane protein (TIGR00697 family)
MNNLILFIHIAATSGLTLMALRLGKEAIIAWLALLTVAMNLFVLKQITLFGLNVTASDALSVGYLLGLNLIQEFFGQKIARKSVWISFFISFGFLILSWIHLAYRPNGFDNTHNQFSSLLTPMPRLLLASLSAFGVVQAINLWFFPVLKTRMQGKFLMARMAVSLFLLQTLDTILFSFLGLYGLVASVFHIICLSLAIKGVVILLSTPFVLLSKRMVANHV